jgi:hypothetical protein
MNHELTRVAGIISIATALVTFAFFLLLMRS